jgi:hypothetical protein
MKHSLFRYFDNNDYAELFLDGKVFFNSLSYFVGFEDGEVRGDADEGTRVHAPSQGLLINNLTQGTTFTITDGVFKSSAKQNEIYVSCMSKSLKQTLWQEFNATCCVEIRVKKQFLQKVRNAVETGRNNFYAGPVTYYDASSPPKHLWALPESVCMSKLLGFKRQDEYRIAFGKTEIFDPNNVDLRLTTTASMRGEALMEPTSNCTIDIGNIREICKVHLSPGTVR